MHIQYPFYVNRDRETKREGKTSKSKGRGGERKNKKTIEKYLKPYLLSRACV